ncbi:MAG TPA: KH domain-containing protein [Thermomicrobiales bacterium]|nr:KH domain-containing protein [Thermomicrobiales bacterium]HQZ89672.1 KH domain-containing protein [Thermomicrobiales bacterium]HRA30644.1 KH domain-containing protein [Thermomicrobiales bacterium]
MDSHADSEGSGADDSAIDSLVALTEYMVENVVEDVEGIQIIPERLGSNVHIKIRVPEEDMGRVIGRQGRIARSMRTILMIAASRKGLRASLDIDS